MMETTCCPSCIWLYMYKYKCKTGGKNGLYWPMPGAHTYISGISRTSKF